MDQHVVFSGIQPTGTLHLGNELGAVKQWLPLQDQYRSFFCIVDLHALTVPQDPNAFPQQVLDTAMDYLALGLDPDEATIYVQSHVHEHVELMWLLNTLTPFGELQRMTQWKDKINAVKLEAANIELQRDIDNSLEKNIKIRSVLKTGLDSAKGYVAEYLKSEEWVNIRNSFFAKYIQNLESVTSAGLLNYPILMAADILLYKATLVPVGEDQQQHVELTRVIAKKFNSRFGETFPLPQAKFNATKRIMSLVDPTVKMSKSHGPASYLALADDPATVTKKIAKAVTATTGGKANPGVANLFTIFREVGDPAVVARFEEQERDGSIRYSDLKTALAKAINEHLTPYRNKRARLAKQPKQVEEILRHGAEKAREVAAATMAEVRAKVGLTTF